VQNNTKKVFRERILTLLRNQKEEERLTKSLVIRDKLFKMPEFQGASTVLFYAPFDGEVDTSVMIEQAQKLGKEIGLPKIIREERKIVPTRVEYLGEDLELGPYGIQQPKEDRTKVLGLEDIDMVIVPCVALDKQNNRLGRGKGYYDRFLKRLSPDIPTVGLAFDFQMIDLLPQKAEHDTPVSHVISN